MTDRPARDSLTKAFADLPRQRADARFTDRVLAELDRRDRPTTHRTPFWVWATAASLVLVSVLAIGYQFQQQQAAKRAYRAQVEELRSRYQTLMEEVASVREEVATPDTRLYLGGDERLDLVLDWGQSPTYYQAAGDRQKIQPASYEQ